MKKIKRLLASLMVVAMLLTTAPLSGFVGLELPNIFDIFASAETYSGTCGDNLTWTFNPDTGELTIDGTGAMYNYHYHYTYNNTPWESYEDQIKTVTIGNSVTTIGDYAFIFCDSLTSVTIGNSVTTIGDYAFIFCDSLTSVTIPDSVTAIGDWSFYMCKSLTSVIIPDSITTIGGAAFLGCDSLTNIEVDADNEYYSSDSFGVLYNKDKTELIEYPIGNERTEFTIPDSVTSISGNAFSSSRNLTSINIQFGVIYIGNSAFAGCNSLKCITIPDSVNVIENNAFEGCVSLKSVTLPDSVTEIESSVFWFCNSLEYITIPQSTTTIGGWAFRNCVNLKSVTIPDSVTSIYDYAFSDCDSLTDVYYAGTYEEWQNISIGTGNGCLTNATIHYSSVGSDVPQSAVVQENLDYYIEEDSAHKKLSMQVTLKDEWFAKDSAEYNHEIGGFCSQFTVLGYTKASHYLTDDQKENGTRPAGYITKNQVLKNALTEMGFSDPEVDLSTNREEVNYFIAHKNITVSGENKTLIFTGFIGSYHDQWYSNFDPGTDDTHKGFNNAKEFVLKKLRNYIEKLNCDVNSTEILITGHSRGAATANLVAAQLIEEATYGFSDEGYAFKENIHTYTFATPNPTTLIDTTYEEYKRIFNIVNPEDFVTKCMPAAWGYARYGTTYVLPSKTNTASGNYKILKANMQNYFSSITNGREYKPYALGEGDTFAVYKSLTGVVRNAWMFEHLPLFAGPMNITPRDFFQNTLCHFVSKTASAFDFSMAAYIIAETLSLPLLSSKVYTDVLKYFIWNGTALNPRFEDAHMAETYCAYMMTMPKAELLREKEALLNTVNCPVDIEVIDNETGDVVGRIVNNVIDEEIAAKDNAIVMTVDGDSKSFWLPSDGDYEVKLTGNDEGTMDYTVSEVDSDVGETQRVNFFDVEITDGKEMTGEINSEDFVLEEYSLSFEDESIEDMLPTEIMSGDEIVNYNININVEGYGNATESMTVASGDYVSLVATPVEGNEFLGWYEDSILISTDMQYSFVAKEDRSLVAKFSTDKEPDTSNKCGDNLYWLFIEETGTLIIVGDGDMYDYKDYGSAPWYDLKSSIKAIEIGDSVTSIGKNAFNNCNRLKSVKIPDGVITVGDYAFDSCNALENVSIGSGVTDIGDCTFLYCDSIIGFDVSEDNIAYSNDEFGVLFNKDKTKLIQYPNGLSLSSYTIPYGVTTIGKFAFFHIGVELATDREYIYNDFGDKLSTIVIPESVTEIENSAFANRYGITSIVIPDSVTTLDAHAFDGCFNLSSITLGKGITKINTSVFQYCISLKDICISNNITEISAYAFNQCKSLTDVYYGGTKEEWNGIEIGEVNDSLLNATIHYNSGICGKNLIWTFNPETGELVISGTGKMTDYTATEHAPWDEYKDQIKKLIVSEGVTKIGNDTFTGYENLEKITLPEGITIIGNSAFRDCKKLTDIEIPATVKTLGHYAFYGCTGLTEVNVGDGVQTLGNFAFTNCSSLKFVTLPEKLAKIGKGAFMGCNALLDAEYKGTDEQWAEVTVGENNDPLLYAMKKVVLGDVNNDGKINSLDALYCLEYSVDNVELTYKALQAADTNGDGVVNSIDALRILQFSVGKIEEF